MRYTSLINIRYAAHPFRLVKIITIIPVRVQTNTNRKPYRFESCLPGNRKVEILNYLIQDEKLMTWLSVNLLNEMTFDED